MVEQFLTLYQILKCWSLFFFIITVTITAQAAKLKVEQSNFVQDLIKGAEKTADYGKQGLKKVNEIRKKNPDLRSSRPHNIMASFTGTATWIPAKLGISYTYSPDATESWEISFNRGKISTPFFIPDLGSISDSHISLLYRSYSNRNSFSIIYGLNYYEFDAHLSRKYLSSISSGDPSDFNVLNVQSIGATVGLGNRWQFENGLSLGVDWFHLNVPLNVFKTKAAYLSSDADQADKNEIENVLDILKRVPTFDFLKLQIGYTF